MSPVTYYVCVVGSGAAGGVMAKELCEGGAKVILLEAGESVPPARFRTHCWPYEMPFRGLRGEKQEPFYPSDLKNTIRYETQEQISVDRIRVLGGRTLHWNAVVLRYSRSDFRERTLNGIEEDWPLSYDELAPYYDRIERMIGVCGNDDGLEVLPTGPWYLPPLKLRCSEQILKRAVAPLGIPVIAVQAAVTSIGEKFSRLFRKLITMIGLTIEGFGFSLGTLSAAASIWRDLAPTPDAIAFDGVRFLREASRREYAQARNAS